MTNLMEPPLSSLREIVARLRAPDGCPWDREQTHRSLRAHLIEEAHEVVEAIDRQDDEHLREELGDLLLQVVLHSQIASETGRFDLDTVAAGIAEKLVRRHPHVFGENKLADSDAVLKQWDAIKKTEKASQHTSALDGVSLALPALMRAEKIQNRAARAGFDWKEVRDVLPKLREELDEIEDSLSSDDRALLEEEIGDLLFATVNLARKAKLDPELTLAAATDKFSRRFRMLERHVESMGKQIEDLTLDEMDDIWNAVKQSGSPVKSPAADVIYSSGPRVEAKGAYGKERARRIPEAGCNERSTPPDAPFASRPAGCTDSNAGHSSISTGC